MNIIPQNPREWVVWRLSIKNRPDETGECSQAAMFEDISHDIEKTKRKDFEATLLALRKAGVVVCQGKTYRLAGKTVYAPPVPRLSERDKVFVATGEYPSKEAVSHEPRF